MFMRKEREEIVAFGKKMLSSGLTLNTGGYLGYYNRKDGAIAISPSATPYTECTPEDVVIVDIEGNKLEKSNGKRRSSEWPVLQAIFKNRDDITAVVHCHSRFASTLSTLREEIPAAYFAQASLGGSLRCTDYYLFTEPELGRDVLEKMEGRNAVLMGNHGLVACGNSIEEAYENAELVEFCCEVYWRARCIGTPYSLSCKQINEMLCAGESYREGGRTKN